MKRLSERHQARAFALVEMLFCVFAASMIIIICGRLFHQIGRVYREVPDAMNTILSDEQWLQRLRADAWSARTTTVDEGGVLTFETSDAVARWSADSDSLSREEAGLITKWPLHEPVTFKREGHLLVMQSKGVSIAFAQANRGGE